MSETIMERLEKLTGPDLEVDEAIHVNVSGVTAEWQDYKQANAYHKDGSWVSIGSIPPYTSSLDAAVALVEKFRPGWKKQFFESYDGLWIAHISSPRRELFSTDYMREREPAGSPNGAIALCLALFRALAKEE